MINLTCMITIIDYVFNYVFVVKTILHEDDTVCRVDENEDIIGRMSTKIKFPWITQSLKIYLILNIKIESQNIVPL